MILTVTVPSSEVFAAYYYGTGEYIAVHPVEIRPGEIWFRYTVVYEDARLARYQADRFLSGLYAASTIDPTTDQEV